MKLQATPTPISGHRKRRRTLSDAAGISGITAGQLDPYLGGDDVPLLSVEESSWGDQGLGVDPSPKFSLTAETEKIRLRRVRKTKKT